MVRAFLISSSCPETFWGEVALTDVYTISHILSPVIGNISPFERLYNHPLDYHILKVFGSGCFVLLQPHEYTKLEPQARLCCFLGYGTKHKCYCNWDPLSKCLRISRHVTFWEHKMFSTISSFQVTETPTPFFISPNVSLFPDDIIADESSFSLSQSHDLF